MLRQLKKLNVLHVPELYGYGYLGTSHALVVERFDEDLSAFLKLQGSPGFTYPTACDVTMGVSCFYSQLGAY